MYKIKVPNKMMLNDGFVGWLEDADIKEITRDVRGYYIEYICATKPDIDHIEVTKLDEE